MPRCNSKFSATFFSKFGSAIDISFNNARIIKTRPYELIVPINELFRFFSDKYFFKTIANGFKN